MVTSKCFDQQIFFLVKRQKHVHQKMATSDHRKRILDISSEGTGTKLVGYGSGRFLSSRVRFGSGRSFNMLGRLS